MFKKFVVPLLLLIIAGYVGLSWFQLKTSNVADLVLCSADRGGIYIPDSACFWYLTSYRNDAEDLDQLSKSGGISFILGVYQPSKQGGNISEFTDSNQRILKIADYFIDKGIAINRIDEIDGLTPLHKEILANNPKLVKYLIDKGADLSIKERNSDLTPLQFAKVLADKNKDIDRSEVISLLEK
jgi:hypothetical protein